MLTQRQTEVAELVARGLSDKRIAQELGVAVETVRSHIQEAASRVPGDGRRRYRLTIWFLNVSEDNG